MPDPTDLNRTYRLIAIKARESACNPDMSRDGAIAMSDVALVASKLAGLAWFADILPPASRDSLDDMSRMLHDIGGDLAGLLIQQSAELRAVNMDRDRADARSKQMREDA